MATATSKPTVAARDTASTWPPITIWSSSRAIHDNVYYGVLVFKEPGSVHGNVIRNNEIARNWGGSVLGRGSRHIFYNNLIHHNRRHGPESRLRRRRGPCGQQHRSIAMAATASMSAPAAPPPKSSTTSSMPMRPISGTSGRSTTLSHNITADPKFVDAGRFDFRVRSGSPAIDGGVRIAAVTKDVDGAPRPQGLTHDVGAFEATPPPRPGSETSGTSGASGSRPGTKTCSGAADCSEPRACSGPATRPGPGARTSSSARSRADAESRHCSERP